jgi:hypothetical protein
MFQSTNLNHAQLALWKICEFDLFDSNRLAGPPIECFVDGTKRSFPDAFSEPLYAQLVSLRSFMTVKFGWKGESSNYHPAITDISPFPFFGISKFVHLHQTEVHLHSLSVQDPAQLSSPLTCSDG